MDNLGGDVRVYSTRNWAENKKRWGPLRSESERITRQVALMKPSDQKESLATLGWMANQGRMEELQVLQGIRKSPSAVDEDTAKLMDIAERQMRQRVYGSSYKDEGNLEPEPRNEERQDISGLELLLRAYRPWLDSDRRHILNQVIPEIRRTCIRERDRWEPHGSLSEPAVSRLPSSLSDDVMHLLLDVLDDQRSAVRQEVAGALGEWGDETAVAPLAQMLVARPRSQRQCAAGLCWSARLDRWSASRQIPDCGRSTGSCRDGASRGHLCFKRVNFGGGTRSTKGQGGAIRVSGIFPGSAACFRPRS